MRRLTTICVAVAFVWATASAGLLAAGGAPQTVVQSAGKVAGTVKDGSGKPVSGAAVQITDLNGKVLQSTTTNDQGMFSIDMPPGDYIVNVLQGSKVVGAACATKLGKGDQITVTLTVGSELPACRPGDPTSSLVLSALAGGGIVTAYVLAKANASPKF